MNPSQAVIPLLTSVFLCAGPAEAQRPPGGVGAQSDEKVQYGVASYYADKFEGRRTANGEVFSQSKMTAAHNALPLGTWIRVTNLRNGRQAVVKVNDRLHHRNRRLVDLSKAAARELGYLQRGITRVKVEVLGRRKPTGAGSGRPQNPP